MYTGYLAIGALLATIGAIGWIALHRRVIFGESVSPVQKPAKLGPTRAPKKTPARSCPPAVAAGESGAKQPATVSGGVSGVTMPDSDPEMVSIRTIAKLVLADQTKETKALETVFSVKAGGSTRYKEVQAKLKQVLKELADQADQADQAD
jgi:hypothetical protein